MTSFFNIAVGILWVVALAATAVASFRVVRGDFFPQYLREGLPHARVAPSLSPISEESIELPSDIAEISVELPSNTPAGEVASRSVKEREAAMGRASPDSTPASEARESKYRELQTVMDRLPFSVDDTGAVNDAFRRWKVERDPKAERVVDLWTFSWVSQYFLFKTLDKPSDIERLITRAYLRVQENREEVRDPDSYARWVTVVCKKTLLLYVGGSDFKKLSEGGEGPEFINHPTGDIDT